MNTNIQMDLNQLHQNIGSYDETLDCLYPVYLLYPKIPKYELIHDEDYFIPLIKRHFIEIKDLKPGDLLVFKLWNDFHFGIYAGEGKFFHCCKKHKLRISRLSGYKKFLRGSYTWHN